MHRVGKKSRFFFFTKESVTHQQTVPETQEADKNLIQLPHLLSNFAGEKLLDIEQI